MIVVSAILILNFQNIQNEINARLDNFSQDVIISQIELLLNYSNRFYNRQFITRKAVNHERAPSASLSPSRSDGTLSQAWRDSNKVANLSLCSSNLMGLIFFNWVRF